MFCSGLYDTHGWLTEKRVNINKDHTYVIIQAIV